MIHLAGGVVNVVGQKGGYVHTVGMKPLPFAIDVANGNILLSAKLLGGLQVAGEGAPVLQIANALGDLSLFVIF